MILSKAAAPFGSPGGHRELVKIRDAHGDGLGTHQNGTLRVMLHFLAKKPKIIVDPWLLDGAKQTAAVFSG